MIDQPRIQLGSRSVGHVPITQDHIIVVVDKPGHRRLAVLGTGDRKSNPIERIGHHVELQWFVLDEQQRRPPLRGDGARRQTKTGGSGIVNDLLGTAATVTGHHVSANSPRLLQHAAHGAHDASEIRTVDQLTAPLARASDADAFNRSQRDKRGAQLDAMPLNPTVQ